jgi:hypothetical protein
MEILVQKGPRGALIPLEEAAEEALRSIKTGAVLRVKINRVRNPKYHRKYMALLNYAYGVWRELMPERVWRGREVVTTFDRFRKEVQIMAGHYEPVWTISGEMRLEPKTISFAGLDEEGFEKLYSEVINVLLQKVLVGTSVTDEGLRRYVDQVLEFD